MSLETTEYTGLLSSLPEGIAKNDQARQERLARRAAKMAEAIIPHLDLIAAEPWFMDDIVRRQYPSLVHYLADVIAWGGSVIVGHEDKQLVGVVALTQLFTGWKATWHAWVHPDYRGSEAKSRLFDDVLVYAFGSIPEVKEAPRGLGLQKLQATCVRQNEQAIRAFAKLGFEERGWMKSEALYQGQLADIVILEKYKQEIVDEGEDGYDLSRIHRPESTSVLPVGSDDVRRQSGDSVTDATQPVGDTVEQPDELRGVSTILQRGTVSLREDTLMERAGHEPAKQLHASGSDGGSANASSRRRKRSTASKSAT